MYSLIFFPSCFCRTITITCTKQLIACVSTWPKRKKKRRLSEQPHCHIIELSKMVFFPIPTSLDPGQTCEMTCLSLSLSSTLSLSFFSSLSLSLYDYLLLDTDIATTTVTTTHCQLICCVVVVVVVDVTNCCAVSGGGGGVGVGDGTWEPFFDASYQIVHLWCRCWC